MEEINVFLREGNKDHGPKVLDHFLNKYAIDSISDILVEMQTCYYNFIMGIR